MADKTWLCVECRLASIDPNFRKPVRLPHRERGTVVLFDVFGEAVCPNCGAQWRRERDQAVLVTHGSVKPATRARAAGGSAIVAKRRGGNGRGAISITPRKGVSK